MLTNKQADSSASDQIRDRISGCLLGVAVGDSLGLPREGLSRQRASQLFGPGAVRHRFVFGRGMISDDAEHSCMVAQALLASGGDPDLFTRSLAWRLRGWLLGGPAGVGLATLHAIVKLWLGWPPSTSGVYSAGNGPAMRSPIIGAYASADEAHLIDLVRASTRLTHTDPRAEQGALVVALACSHGVKHGPVTDASGFISSLRHHVKDEQLSEHINAVEEHLLRGSSAEEFAESLGLGSGVSGFVNHTVPAALFCWLRYDAREAVEKVILLGGDTDTTAAIVGGMVGAAYGTAGLCPEWIAGIAEWPRSTPWIRQLGERLADSVSGKPRGPLPLFWPGIPFRNAAFTMIVLYHGFRRIFPPY